MKKIVLLLICLFPLINVNAENKLTCLTTTYEEPFKIESSNFTCSNVSGEKLAFFQNENDLKDYFTYSIDNGVARITVSDKLKFESGLKSGLVKINDDKHTFTIYIKNSAYVKPTETTSTTTTTALNEITYTVILDNNGLKEEKKCNVKKSGDTCFISLPNLEIENFNGWGNSKECQNGSIGSTKISENKTFYACFEKKENIQNKELYLNSLKVFDNNNDEMNYGIFSIKKREYNLKVLYEVDKLIIEATADENINIEYSGHENLVVGDNEVIIKLTDENNITSEYKINVIRLEEGKTISNINYLSALVVGNYNINFNKNIFDYNLLIDKDIYKLVINAVPLNEEHLIEIKNNNNLENGSIINVNVLDDEGNVTTYNIKINKDSNNLLLYVAIGTIFLLIIVLIILIIIKKKQKKKNENKSKKKNTEQVEVLNI